MPGRRATKQRAVRTLPQQTLTTARFPERPSRRKLRPPAWPRVRARCSGTRPLTTSEVSPATTARQGRSLVRHQDAARRARTVPTVLPPDGPAFPMPVARRMAVHPPHPRPAGRRAEQRDAAGRSARRLQPGLTKTPAESAEDSLAVHSPPQLAEEPTPRQASGECPAPAALQATQRSRAPYRSLRTPWIAGTPLARAGCAPPPSAATAPTSQRCARLRPRARVASTHRPMAPDSTAPTLVAR